MSFKQQNAVFFPSSVGTAHVQRLRLLCDELEDSIGQSAFAMRGATNMGLRGIKKFEVPDILIEDFNKNIFAKYSPDLIDACVTAEVELIGEFQPCMVIGDMRLSLAISSRLTGTPYISLVNGYMTDYFNPVAAMMSKEKRPLQYQIASLLGRMMQKRQKRKLARNFRKVARKHGVKGLNSLYDFLRGDLTLVADIPEFCPLDSLPENIRYIGPLIWEGANAEVPEFVSSLPADKKLIYVTIGNTGPSALVKRVLEAFVNQKDYIFIITTGAFVNLNHVSFPDHFFVQQFIPGSAVMKKASLCIHCGGNGTTYQALTHGVPSIVVPFNTDQLINAHLVNKHKVGIALSARDVTAQSLRKAVETLNEMTIYQENTHQFQLVLKNWNGPKQAVKEIKNYLDQKIKNKVVEV